jgi:hypothetical protein
MVAMVPRSFAFRAVVGSLEIAAAGSSATPALVAETVSLYLSCVPMTAAIAMGIAAPFIVLPPPARAASLTQLAQDRVLGKAKSAIDAIGQEQALTVVQDGASERQLQPR